jgi:hypothetical protein
MPVLDVYLNAALAFRLMWAIRTLELGLLATLKANMSYHILLVPITFSTNPALEVLLSSMTHHIIILHCYWHAWMTHVSIRSNKLPCHASTAVLSVKMLTNATGGLPKPQVPFEFCCVKILKITLLHYCNRMV